MWCLHVYVCVYMCVHTCVYIRMCVHIRTCAYVCLHTCVFTYLRMYVMYITVDVCGCTYMGVARGGSGGSEEPPSLTMAMDYVLLKP